MGCNNSKAIPIVNDDADVEDDFPNPLLSADTTIAATISPTSKLETDGNTKVAPSDSSAVTSTATTATTTVVTDTTDTTDTTASTVTSATAVTTAPSPSTTTATADDKDATKNKDTSSPNNTTSAKETDAEFLQRRENEDKAAFSAAVEEWRAEKKAGKGEAKIIESGGGFAASGQASDSTLSANETKDKPVAMKQGDTNEEDTEEKMNKISPDNLVVEEDEGLGISPFLAYAIQEKILPADAMEKWTSEGTV